MLDDRFWTKVDKSHPSGCWVWTANRNNKGYGLFRPGGTLPKRLVHRLSYEAFKGAIPRGGLILHSCDNRICVNPDHLQVGTFSDNVADMDARGRRVANPARGEKHRLSKVSDDTVLSLRREYVAGASVVSLAARYGILVNSVSEYVGGRSWTHLNDLAPSLAELRAERSRRMKSAAKITMADAEEIRRRLASGERGIDLAAEFGLSRATISNIKLRQIWA